jgi:hypothetical protein
MENPMNTILETPSLIGTVPPALSVHPIASDATEVSEHKFYESQHFAEILSSRWSLL